MRPEQKASQLLQKFTDTIFESGNTVSKPMIKEVAAICVQEIIKVCLIDREQYWQQVLNEIQKP